MLENQRKTSELYLKWLLLKNHLLFSLMRSIPWLGKEEKEKMKLQEE